MSTSLSGQAHVGRRVAMTVVWTVILVVGLGLGLLLGVSDLASLVQQASMSTTGERTAAVGVAVAMVLSGIWGIAASHRNLKHSVDLIAEVDKARTAAIRMESTRYMERPK